MDYREMHRQLEEGLTIPVKKKMKLDLKKATPSGYPISKLKAHLTDLNLTCKETTEESLREYKREVMESFRPGNKEIFSLQKVENNRTFNTAALYRADGSYKNLKGKAFFHALGANALEETGSWVLEDDAGGYRQELAVLVYPDHFDKLAKEHKGFFAGSSKKEERTINEPTGQVIRDTFSNMALVVTGAIPGGITTEDLETLVSVILGKNQSTNIKDYEMDSVLYVFMVNGYDPKQGAATSVGGLSISYRIHIKNYTDKSDNKDGRYNDAEISITARFVSYSELDDMDRDLQWLTLKCRQLFMPENSALEICRVENQSMNDIPINPNKIVVYNKLPKAGTAVFKSGLPVTASGDYLDTMIFFCPDLENLGYVDNKDSDVATNYSKSVTVGFEKSIGTAISMETSMEMDLTVAKYGVKMGISMNMTSSWNESQTESISFTVEGRKEAYLYQGRMQSIILRFSPSDGSFQYIEDTRNVFLTNAIKTTEQPIIEGMK